MKFISLRPLVGAPFAAVVVGVLLVGSVVPATAASTLTPVQGTAQYLTGSLLNAAVITASKQVVASYAGTGSSDSHDLQSPLQALAVQTLAMPGNNVGVPTDFSNIGIVDVHAEANPDGSALASAGLLNAGTTSYDLSQAVTALGLPAGAELSSLSLALGATSSSASRSASGVIARSYNIASGNIVFVSPTLSGLTTSLDHQVSLLQTTLDHMSGTAGPAVTALNGLTSPALVSNVSISPVDLSSVVQGFQQGNLSDSAHPGVSINLSTGAVTIDLAAITTLNGRDPNTQLITPALLQTIEDSITALVTDYGNRVTSALTTALRPLSLSASASPTGLVLSISQTLGQALDHAVVPPVLAPAGVSGAKIADALTEGITALATGLGALTSRFLTPVTATTLPAISTVLAAAIQLTVNVQSETTDNTVYATGASPIASTSHHESALSLDVLPTLFNTPSNALVLNVAHSNVASPATAYIVSLTPPTGPEAGDTLVTITGGCFTDATGVTFDGIAGTDFTVVNDATITVRTPPGVGTVDVTVTGSATCGDATLAQSFTYVPVANPQVPVVGGPVTTITDLTPNSGPESGGTRVTITGTCFIGAAGVRFGGFAQASYIIINDTTIIATAPPGTGTVDVTVTGTPACGDATYSNAFHYIPAVLPASIGDKILAFTGGPIASWLIPIAILALLAGLALMFLRRRARRS